MAASPGFKVMAEFRNTGRPPHWGPAADWRLARRTLVVLALIQLAFVAGLSGLFDALEEIESIWAAILGAI